MFAITGLIVPSGYFRVNTRIASKGDHPGNAKTTPGHHASTKGRLERGGVPRWSSVEITRSREIWLNVTPVTLTGARAKVIPMEASHAEALYQAGGSPEIWPYMPMWPKTPDDMRRLVREALAARDKGGEFPFVIVDQQTGRIVGSPPLLEITPPPPPIAIRWTRPPPPTPPPPPHPPRHHPPPQPPPPTPPPPPPPP